MALKLPGPGRASSAPIMHCCEFNAGGFSATHDQHALDHLHVDGNDAQTRGRVS